MTPRSTSRSTARTVLRPAAWLYVAGAVAVAIPPIGLVLVYPSEGFSALTAGLVGVTVLFTAALLDLLVSRIELNPDGVRVVELHRRRTYPRAEIESVKLDGGTVFLKLRSGGWAQLPNTGRSALGDLNSVQAWLGRTS